jgi:glycosyltransferase involved in cell wall biosynthesis
VLTQTRPAKEILVVDDNSQDDTASVIGSYSDPRITLIQFDENRGANAARNAGINRSSGEFISFLDSDDRYHSKHLEKTVEKLNHCPPATGGVYVTERFRKNGSTVRLNRATEVISEPAQVIRDYSVGGFSCMTFRKGAFESVGLLDESLDAFQDRDFLIRFLEQYDLDPVPEPLVEYTIHENRISENPAIKIDALDQFVEKHGDQFERKDWGYIYYTRGHILALNGDLSSARSAFYKALQSDPMNPRYIVQAFASSLGRTGFDFSRRVINLFKRVSTRFLSRSRIHE